MPNDCTDPALLVGAHEQSPWSCGDPIHNSLFTHFSCISLFMGGKRKLSQFSKAASQAASQAKKLKTDVERKVNQIDRALNGMVLSNPVVQSMVPYASAASRAIDAFDSLLSVDGVTAHPQIAAGTSAGVSQTVGVARSRPRITGSKGQITIMHKELVSEVYMVSALATNPTMNTGESIYTVSPSNDKLFPWLSSIASSYDYYKFNRVRLVYVPLCSTATSGRVMLGYDPDASDAIPLDRQALSAFSCSADSSAWGVSKLDCKLPTNQPWYQTNNISTSAQYSTSAMGQVFWATWAGSGTSTVGELYVLYEVTLKDPQPSALRAFKACGTGATITANFPLFAPFSVQATATEVQLNGLANGTYDLMIVAKTTANTAAVGVNASGGISVIGPGTINTYKVSDTVDAIIAVQVNVTNPGYTTAPGVITTPARVAFSGLAALGAWSLWAIPAQREPTYPSYS